MNKKIDNWINEADKAGDNFFERIVKLIAKGTFDFVVKDNKIAQAFLSVKTAFMVGKISLFLNYINDTKDEETISFIDELNSEEKKFFIESINKVIDLDDELQIYILADLVKKYKINNELNYYEKQLFYNINTFSKDDFKIFYCIYSDKIKENISSFYLTDYIKKEIISISLNKFAHLGLIHFDTSRKSYELSEYSKTLFSCLQGCFTHESCTDIIMKFEYAKIKGGFNR